MSECDNCGENVLDDECDEIFIKDYLRRFFIKKDYEYSKKEFKNFQKAKKRIDPLLVLNWNLEIAKEEYNMMSDNPRLSDV